MNGSSERNMLKFCDGQYCQQTIVEKLFQQKNVPTISECSVWLEMWHFQLIVNFWMTHLHLVVTAAKASA